MTARPEIGNEAYTRVRLASSKGEESAFARQRILSRGGDPFLLADWKNVVFLHYRLNPESLKAMIPAPLELELHEGKAVVTLVALTMRRLRPFRRGALMGWVFRALQQQSFLNVRTYVRWGNEAGALFVWGFLSKPFGFSFPMHRAGFPCGFGELNYEHDFSCGKILGKARCSLPAAGIGQNGTAFSYEAAIDPRIEFKPCEPGSLAEFAMERYSGFYARRRRAYVFRAWHGPWLQAPIEVTIKSDGLLREHFPWFGQAKFAGANFAPGFEGVWLGRAHRLDKAHVELPARRHGASTLFEMP